MENKFIERSVNFQLRELTQEMIDNREAEFVISSEAVDTFNTVFLASGGKFDRYMENPIVCYMHRANSENPDLILGTCTKLFQESGKTIARVKFEDADINPLAEKVFRKIQAGTLRMASIGVWISDWRYGDTTKGEDKNVVYFTDWTLYEWSIVSVGSNPDAVKRSEQTIEEIRSLLAKDLEVVNPENVSFHKRNMREKEFELLNNK